MNRTCSVVILTAALMFTLAMANAQSTGTQAELRSSSAIIPPTPGVVAPTAPAGSILAGPQTWACDAGQGFRPVVPAEQGVADPILAISTTAGVKLPLSAATTPTTCGQMVVQNGDTVYITQAVVDTTVTPSSLRGVLRATMDGTGALLGTPVGIATTAGLDGDQPTALALGPDGNLYVGFLKNGNIKKIVNPGVGTTQVVQSVGGTPQGHPARAIAFVGGDLWVASVDALSVIRNATSSTCTGGCNAVTVIDGFAGVSHTGMTYDGNGNLYFSVAGNAAIPGSSQVWRLSMTTGLYTFVAQGGADRTGANASNFSFVAAKTNLLNIDATGTLWIGDDTSNATATGAGRLWTVSASTLAGLSGGSSVAGTNVQAIFNVLRGPWIVTLITPSGTQTSFVPTFNADGTFTATLTPLTPPGAPTNDSGTWLLTPPKVVQPFGNAQAHLSFTDSAGVVLFSNDVLLLTVDSLTSLTTGTGSLGAQFGATWAKFGP